jgi:phosphatidylserine/phosphatidylglycerophosphate/cardiolipin synthase-like enzyme
MPLASHLWARGPEVWHIVLAGFALLFSVVASAHVILWTCIFDRDEAGSAFAQALGQAVRRGVEVRVLVDAARGRYSWPSIPRALRRQGVRRACFLPSSNLWRLMSLNPSGASALDLN